MHVLMKEETKYTFVFENEDQAQIFKRLGDEALEKTETKV